MVDNGPEFLSSPIPELSKRQPHPSGGLPVAQSSSVSGTDATTALAAVRADLTKGRIGEYTGEMGAKIRRGIQGYEGEWNREETMGKRSYDQLIISAVERALVQKRKEVTIFDFGCGDARAIEEFLAQKDSQAIELIRAHPDIQVNFVGLTDTPGVSNVPQNAEGVAKGRDLQVPDGQPENLSAHIDYSAISGEQPLEEYFQKKGIEKIDVAMAVQSLPYLSAEDFAATLQSMIGRLQPSGGTVIAAPYATRVSGFYRGLFGAPALEIDNPTLELDSEAKLFMKNGRGSVFYKPDVDLIQEVARMKKAFEYFIKEGSLTQSELDDRISSVLPLSVRALNKMMRKRPQVEQLYGRGDKTIKGLDYVSSILYGAEEKLGSQRMETLRQQKRGVLAQLKEEHAEDAEIDFGEHVISVVKK